MAGWSLGLGGSENEGKEGWEELAGRVRDVRVGVCTATRARGGGQRMG